MSPALLDRLRLNEARIAGMAQGMREIVALPDPVGRVLSGGNRPNGLQIVKVAVPLGVVAVIFEARPNVTADAAALCLKSGQCGDSARRQGGDPFQPGDCCRDARRIGAGGASARLHPARGGLRRAIPPNELMRLNAYVDVLIPQGRWRADPRSGGACNRAGD